MTIIPAFPEPIAEASIVALARYAQLIGYWECSFFGVRRDGAPQSCRSIWVKRERDLIARYLAEAQEEIEQEIGYPIGEWRWFSDRLPYAWPVLAVEGYVIEGGIRATTTVKADAPVDHTNDPAVVGPIATTVTDEDELHLFYPDSLIETDIEIHPSDIDLVGGFVTFYVPRCRMVHPDYVDNDRTGVDYTDTLNAFLQTVDVVRVYNDDSTHASLVWPHTCDSCASCTCPTCSEYTQDGCIYVKDGEIGALDVLPASYSGGTWTRVSACCCDEPAYVTVNYRAGVALTRQAEDCIIRLAHSKMPAEPCSCELVRFLWERDRHIPDLLTRERINCRFGLSDGAWTAWQFAQAMKLHRGGRPL